jgi:hypothetical protein
LNTLKSACPDVLNQVAAASNATLPGARTNGALSSSAFGEAFAQSADDLENRASSRKAAAQEGEQQLEQVLTFGLQIASNAGRMYPAHRISINSNKTVSAPVRPYEALREAPPHHQSDITGLQ